MTARDDTRSGAVLHAYRQLETQAARLARLAGAQDWDGLVDEEEGYVAAVARLADLEKEVDLDAPQRDAKSGILERILAHDLDIRSRLLARREELSRLMAVSRREQALDRFYHSGTGGGAAAAALAGAGSHAKNKRP